MSYHGFHHSPVGTHDDICQRIRRFYGHWNRTIGEVPTKIALPAEDIDIEVEKLTSEQTQHYGASHAYIASGIVVRGLYPGTDARSKGLVNGQWIVESYTIPKAVARCARVNTTRTSKSEREAGEQIWINAQQNQTNPVWRRLIEGQQPQGMSCDIQLAKWYALPRAVALQPSFPGYKKNNPSEIEMNKWLDIVCESNTPFSLTALDGYTDHWYQLTARPELTGSFEERKKGSPSTPYFTPFRLTISRQGHPDETVVVIFSIVPDENGRFKPWTKQAHVQRLPPMICHETSRPRYDDHASFASDPEAYKGRLRPSEDYHWGSHWQPPKANYLSHRKQRIYQQVSAFGGNRLV